MAYKPNYSAYESSPTTKTGTTTLTSQDLSKYGIDYSQEQQDAIANIFKQSATGAYQQAQNQYAKDMANQQATLSDTIRRSQADAVATGASRGLQAANELSAILGLQQAAAEGATQMQGDYAAALAQAQQQAAELQNTRAQTGAQLYAADSAAAAQRYEAEQAAEAQRYAANVDFASNDFMRIFSELSDAKANDSSGYANAMLKAYLAANGVPADQLDAVMNSVNADYAQYATDENGNPIAIEWTPGKDGIVSNATFPRTGIHTEMDFGDIAAGKNEDGLINFNGKDYYVKVSGAAETNAEIIAQLNKLTGGPASNQQLVYYKGKAYISVNGEWHAVKDTGTGASRGANFSKFVAALSGNEKQENQNEKQENQNEKQKDK